MSATSIGWAGLAASFVLIVVAVALSGWQRLHLSRSILWASARAAVQLLLVGWALRLVLDPDASVAWAWLWVVVMITFAGITIRNRAPEVPGILWLGTLSMFTVIAVSLSVIFGFGIFPIEGRTVVPLAGMMIGNSMTSCVLVGRRIVGEFSDKRSEVERALKMLVHTTPISIVKPSYTYILFYRRISTFYSGFWLRLQSQLAVSDCVPPLKLSRIF